MNLKSLSTDVLVSKFRGVVASERKITAEVIEYVREIDSRKAYLKLEHNSLFSFLTKEVGYTPAAAQRRIDAARLSREIPEVCDDVRSGKLNLSQVSLLAQNVRQSQKRGKKVKTSQKRIILMKIKSQDLEQTARVVAQELDLPIEQHEKKTIQKDGSVRVETTFEREEYAELERVKELISHQMPGASFKEVTLYLARHFLQQKDPLKKVQVEDKSPSALTSHAAASASEVDRAKHQPETSEIDKTNRPPSASRLHETRYRPVKSALRAAKRRLVFQRYPGCRWKDLVTGRICGSRFQLQIDHIVPKWAGGTDDIENLHVLCSVHNQLKFRMEMQGHVFTRDSFVTTS